MFQLCYSLLVADSKGVNFMVVKNVDIDVLLFVKFFCHFL